MCKYFDDIQSNVLWQFSVAAKAIEDIEATLSPHVKWFSLAFLTFSVHAFWILITNYILDKVISVFCFGD